MSKSKDESLKNQSDNQHLKDRTILYDRLALSEKLDDLRHDKGLSLTDLSDEIKTKTKISISGAQLGKYENPNSTDLINLNNLFALAKYYEVSIYNLLGMNDCKDADNEEIHKRIGLDDEAIKSMEMCNYNNPYFIDTINFLLTSEKFWNFIALLTQYRYRTPVIMTLLQNLDKFDNAMLELRKKIKEAKQKEDLETVKELRKRANELNELLGYYAPNKKKPITPERVNTMCLFEIGEVAQELAEEYLNQNNKTENNTTNNKKKK